EARQRKPEGSTHRWRLEGIPGPESGAGLDAGGDRTKPRFTAAGLGAGSGPRAMERGSPTRDGAGLDDEDDAAAVGQLGRGSRRRVRASAVDGFQAAVERTLRARHDRQERRDEVAPGRSDARGSAARRQRDVDAGTAAMVGAGRTVARFVTIGGTLVTA